MPSQIFFVGLIIFLAHFLSALFDKKKIPDVLPLVFLGLLLGPVSKIVTPVFFGGIGNIFTTVTLIIILFQGGLELNLSSLKASISAGLRLTLINFLAAVFTVTAISVFLFEVSLLEGLLLGTILGGTSSAIVIPFLKKLRLKEQSRTALFLESTFSDVLCIVISLGLLQAIKNHALQPGFILGQIVSSFFLAAVIGILAALFWSTILYKIRHLENGIFLTPAFVFVLYGINEILGYSGAISALSFGITLGNIQDFNIPLFKKFVIFRHVKFNDTENAFFAEIVFLLKTFFFIYIGLSININSLYFMLSGLSVTLFLFLIRIPVVRMAMKKTTVKFDASIISAMVPKGLAAAVLASLPLQAGLSNGVAMRDIVYAVILFSIIFTSLLVFLIEKNLLPNFYAIAFSRYSNENIPTIITSKGKTEVV